MLSIIHRFAKQGVFQFQKKNLPMHKLNMFEIFFATIMKNHY